MNIPKIINEIGEFEDYGCEINKISIQELFTKYETLGFIYPEKKRRLSNLMPTIEENWIKLLSIEPSVLQIVTFKNEDNIFGTMSMFKSCNHGWVNHHGIANKLSAVALTFLAAQKIYLENLDMNAGQIWFQPNNRIMAKVCEHAISHVPKNYSFNRTFNYIEFPINNRFRKSDKLSVVPYAAKFKDKFCQFILKERGKAFLEGEELNSDDIELADINSIYKKVGLERYRRIWLVFDASNINILGTAIAYKGPVGLNFSFLENRCEIIIDSSMNAEENRMIVEQLISCTSEKYQDFPPAFIPVIADDKVAKNIIKIGGKIIRQYTQHLWLRPGFKDWYFGAITSFKQILLRAHQQHILI